MTEVAAFTERREIIKVDTSGTAKSRLLASLRLAIEGSVTDVTLKPATELLGELAQAEYFRPWRTAFQSEGGHDFKLIADSVSDDRGHRFKVKADSISS